MDLEAKNLEGSAASSRLASVTSKLIFLKLGKPLERPKNPRTRDGLNVWKFEFELKTIFQRVRCLGTSPGSRLASHFKGRNREI